MCRTEPFQGRKGSENLLVRCRNQQSVAAAGVDHLPVALPLDMDYNTGTSQRLAGQNLIEANPQVRLRGVCSPRSPQSQQ